MKQPFFGPNAVPFVILFALLVALTYAKNVYWGVKYYSDPTCAEAHGYPTCRPFTRWSDG